MRLWHSREGRFNRVPLQEKKQVCPAPRIIAVTSGKGGVGKTSFSVNLALSLAKLGRQVTLFDADLGLANAEILLGMVVPYSLYKVLYEEKTIEEIAQRGPLGIDVISGGCGFLEMANLDHIRRQRLLRMLERYCMQREFVLIDTGAGISKSVLGFIASAGEVIVVVTPEPTSLADAYALIKVLSNFKVHSEVNLVINRAADRREAVHTFGRLQTAANRFLEIKLNSLGWIPEDRLVSQAVKMQQPFILTNPGSSPSRSVDGIARFILEGVPPESNVGFWGKLLGLFS